MNIKHILVDMDPTQDEQPALTKAITLAKEFNASIELFLVDYHSGLVANWFYKESHLEELKNEFLASKKRWLDTYVQEALDSDLTVSTDVRWHKPIYEGIIDKASECHADLVIKSTHKHPTINKTIFTPNDWQLLKKCPIPLLLVKSNNSLKYQNILAAIDPSQAHNKELYLDKVILNTTQELSSKLSATAHVAHCYEPVSIPLWNNVGFYDYSFSMPVDEHEKYINDLNRYHLEAFNKMIENYQFDKENQYLEAGNASRKLLDIVNKHNINLIVMGTTYHSGLLGSTVEKVLDDINCDILAVKCEA